MENNSEKLIRLAAYCRVSTAKEAQLESLENQELFFNQFAKKNNYNLIKIYADEGISGKQMKNRTQFLKMLQDAKAHTFDLVVVKDISRFARNTVDFLQVIRKLKGEHIDVKFLSTNQTILGDSEFVLTIFSALAQEESANLSKRVQFGMKLAEEKGKVPTVIYGYDKTGKRELTINSEEAKIVKYIFHLYVNEGLGTRKIGFILDNKHVPTKHNAEHWTPRTIRRIIMNPIYCGILENHKYITTDFLTNTKKQLPKEQRFQHDTPQYQIVSKEIWDKAQCIMKDRESLYHTQYVHTQGHYSNRHLFSTLIKCEQCGYSFCRKKFHTNKSGDIVYWRCSGNNNRGPKFCDNNINVYENDLIQKLKEYFQNIVTNKEDITKLIINKILQDYKTMDTKDLTDIKKELDKINSMEEKYKIMFANSLISLDELKNHIQKFELKKTDLQKEIEENQQLINRVQQKNYIAKNMIENINHFLSLKTWTNNDLRKIITNISVNKNGTITFHMKY